MPEIRRVNFKRIEGLRLDLGLNKQSFCRKAGICNFTYNRLPDATRIKDDCIIRIASALQVKPSELIYWENETETLQLKSQDPGETKKRLKPERG